MESSFWFDAIHFGWSIVYTEEYKVTISTVFVIANRVDPDEMPDYVAFIWVFKGAQWLSGKVLDSGPRGRGFEPQRCHCVVVLEQDTFILA